MSAPIVSNIIATGALSISNNSNSLSIGVPAFSIGTQTANKLILTAGSNVTLSQSVNSNGATITINANRAVTLSYFNPQDAYEQTVGNHGNGTMHFQPLQVPTVQFDRIAMPIYYTNASNTTASVSLTINIGIYTRNVSTLSLASSLSYSTAWVGSGTANSASYHGIRLLTVGYTNTLLEGQYYMGVMSRSASGGAAGSLSQIVAVQQSSNYNGIFGQAMNATHQYTRGLGYYSTSLTNAPSSVAFSQLYGTAAMALRQPFLYFVSGTF